MSGMKTTRIQFPWRHNSFLTTGFECSVGTVWMYLSGLFAHRGWPWRHCVCVNHSISFPSLLVLHAFSLSSTRCLFVFAFSHLTRFSLCSSSQFITRSSLGDSTLSQVATAILATTYTSLVRPQWLTVNHQLWVLILSYLRFRWWRDDRGCRPCARVSCEFRRYRTHNTCTRGTCAYNSTSYIVVTPWLIRL